MAAHSPQAYLGIATSLAVVATFAGGFTYGNVITLQTSSSTCNIDDDTSTLLSIAFILFTISLFITILIQVNLRAYDPTASLQENDKTAHNLVQIIFFLSASCLVGGFVLLHLVLIGLGQSVTGPVGIAVVGLVAIISLGFGCCTRD